MPDVPFPITGETMEDIRTQVWELIRHVFEERIGGGELGDVFTISGDLFELRVSSTGGLEKSSNQLQLKVDSTGGLQTDSDGSSIKLKTGGGLGSDSSGLYVDGREFVSGETEHAVVSLADGASTTKDVTVTGAALGGAAIAGWEAIDEAGWTIEALVTAADTVRVTITNNTGSGQTISGTVSAFVWNPA